ncbi:type II secretion system protein [Clostridium aestuarii]|uniref:Type II secretion system protein n=1 Tax=Clostridium aestuarii TaxID=338193 RepID=A0ABT4D025_9CLOT|nr:type II secretion system protein [Clostridium aestuarii]MCY6484584.1 type II secretion system protein [Clostridium aestuarii]
MVNIKRKKGVTLLELLITLAILGMVIMPLSNMVITSLKISIMSSNEQKSANLAQKYMEKMKSEDASTIDTTQTFLEDGFEIECAVNNISDYEFTDINSSGNNTKSINYDYRIKVNDSITEFYKYDSNVDIKKGETINVLPPIIVTKTDSNISFNDGNGLNIEDSLNKKEVKIRVDINREIDNSDELKVTAENNQENSTLIFYFIKSSTVNNKPNINLIKSSGQIKSYYNILSSDDSDKSTANTRIYLITVTVKKGGKTLITNKSYKSFYE